MIEINLLPVQMRVRKKEPSALPSIPVVPVAIGIVSLLVLLQVLLFLAVQFKGASLSSLKKKNEKIKIANVEAVRLDESVKLLSSKADVVDKLRSSRFSLAKKLNDLSDAMVTGTWLRSIDVRKGDSPSEPGVLKEVLVIEGSSVVSDGREDGSIGKFVNSLKDNASFSEDFDEVELSKVERKKIKNTEVLDFVIICHFKKGRGL
ncbi:MAG TPA: hypothetical protein PLV09_03800 [Candidatus Omnitrophota bacterium]|mgnify:CR=1 FL=1|jgi:Tfp pilus assembly protein PilN|nr:hypothetical protein [Candidatus Omnitrophota bacterium]MDD5270157.1 hypothetical protein [Candidatus Omnitrophota bacterium]MDD5737332.1 hypothetical protein [Candidatus Omnitrophota bacterium]HOX09947.1 hypothetical protein [Candidatus Omnitrophota bacterium]HPN66522.1 hypothetical protein [Candidatus Omnitrophota bacterium]